MHDVSLRACANLVHPPLHCWWTGLRFPWSARPAALALRALSSAAAAEGLRLPAPLCERLIAAVHTHQQQQQRSRWCAGEEDGGRREAAAQRELVRAAVEVIQVAHAGGEGAGGAEGR